MALRIILALGPLAFIGALPVLEFLVWMAGGPDVSKAFPVLITAAAYTSVALLGWALGYPRVSSTIVISSAFLAVFGFAGPILFNGLVTHAANRVPATESPAPGSMTEPQVVAVLTPATPQGSRYGRTEMECGLLCQRLLYRGDRTAVLAGPAPPDGNPSKASDLTRYWIERRTTCPAVYISPAAALPGEHFMWGTDPTSDFTRQQVKQGRCLMSGPGSLSEADTVVTEARLPYDGSSNEELVVGIQTGGETLYQRRAGRWSVVARATTVRYTTVKIPLRFWSVGRELRIENSEQARPTLEPVVERALGPWLGGA